jgi:uncharacterized protein (DUF302 family)
MVVTSSTHSYDETCRRLIEAIERRPLTVFARIDHAAGAREVGLDMPDEQVVVFGNARAGTPLMIGDPRVGIELPLRVLIWAGEDAVLLGFRDPRELQEDYAIAEHAQTLDKMAALLGEVVAEAAG